MTEAYSDLSPAPFQPASRQTPEFLLAGKGLAKEKGRTPLLYLSSPVRPGNLLFTEIIQAGKGTKGKGEVLSAVYDVMNIMLINATKD